MLDRPWSPPVPPYYLAKECSTLGELFLRRVERDGHRVAFKQRIDGRWVPATWREFYRRSAAIAGFLTDQGVEPGDKVCIVGSTRPEWCYADMGGQLAGAVTLGAYPTLTAEQLAYILNHADVKVAFVEGAAEVEKIAAMREKLPLLKLVCVWDRTGLSEAQAQYDWLLGPDAMPDTVDDTRIAERVRAVAPERTALIVYTSGTTGQPKGAMISHRNVIAWLRAVQESTPLSRDDYSFSFLPMAHVAERISSFYSRINSGFATCFASSIPQVLSEIKEVRPHIFGSVPRIFEKAYAHIKAEVSRAAPGKQAVFRWAEAVGRKVVKHWQAGERIPLRLRVQYEIADRLVFAKLRDVFGGQVRFFMTGAAPISAEILEFFWAAGFPIYEVYGMTEATVITHANWPGQVRLGSVGHALSIVEERLAEDGEILIRGDTVFQGYYKDPEATREAIDDQGWLHTGDIGRKDKDGYLYIIDRKKHIIITAGGKNITPANVENEIKAADSLISQVHAHGDRRPYLTALITIGSAEAVQLAAARGIVSATDAARLARLLAENPLARTDELAGIIRRVTEDTEVRARVVAAVQRANQRLSRVETVKKVYLLDRELSIEEDELTPTLKVKRKNIEHKLAAIWDRLYDDDSFGLMVMAKH